MVKTPTSRTLVRAGVFYNDLATAVKKSSLPLKMMEFGLGNVVKFCAYDVSQEPYLLIVSQQVLRQISPEGYNTQL